MNNINTATGNITNISNTVNNIVNGGGIKYFHANSGQADSVASGSDAVAIGGAAVASNTYAIAAGANSTASGYGDVALGYFTHTSGTGGATAVGDQSSALAGGAFAGGLSATAAGTNSVALGQHATATTANSVALGSNALANATTLGSAGFAPVGGTAISASTAAGEVSVGAAGAERRITNVAAGLNGADAVNVSQLMSEDAKVNNVSNSVGNLSNTVNNIGGNVSNINNQVTNIVNGGGIKYFHANSTLADSVATGVDSVAIGGAATAVTANSVALGANSVANSTMLGSAGFAPVGGTAIAGATAAGEVSVGKAGAERRITNVAAGLNGTDAVNVSQLMSEDAKVNNVSNNVGNLSNTVNNIGGNVSNINNQVTNIVNGGGIKYFHANSTLADSVATGVDSVAIGGNASATTANSVALGANSVANSTTLGSSGYNPGSTTISGATAAGEVSVGKAGAERRITNVAAGYAATDAVNVSQLMSEDAKVNAQGTGTAAALGGGSTYNTSTGAITNPTYVVGGSTYNNVGGAITNIDGRVTQNTTDISNIQNQINNGGIGLVQQANSTATVTVAKGTAGSLVDFTGTAGARRLTGVANGNVNASSVDAVNGSQLFNVAQSTANAIGGGSTVNGDGTISNPTYVVGGNTYNNVGGAITSIDGRVTNINNTVTNIVNGGGIKYFHANSTLADSVATGANSVAIGGAATAVTANSVALGANSVANSTTLGTSGFAPVGGTAISAGTAAGEVSVGAAGAERRITNVAAGLNGADAVNVSQLMSEDAKVNNVSNSVGNLSNTVNNIGGNVSNINNQVTNIVNGGGIKYFHANSTLADSVATGVDSVAIGGNAQATAANSVALGSNSTTTANLSAAAYNPGTGTLAGTAPVGEVSVGKAGAERRVTNVAAGSAATDAVNVSQLQSAIIGSTANAVAYDDGTKGTVTLKGAGGTKITNLTAGNLNATSTDAVNGSQLYQTNQNVSNLSNNVANIAGNVTNINNTVTNIVNGGGIKYFHANSTLADSVATGVDSVAIGGNAQATAANSVALGSNSTTTANLSAAAYNPGTGTLAGTAPVGEVSVGKAGAERRVTNVAAGSAATDAVNVSQLQSAIIGSTANAVAYDDGTKGTVTLKGAGGTKITNLTAGNLSATSVDAVNGSQLFNVAQSTANAIGGGSTVNGDGTISNPTYVVGGNTYNNVGGAITSIDGRVTNINNTVTNIVNGGGIKYFHANSMLADSVATGVNSVAIGGNASATAANSVALGSNATTTANLSATAYNPGSSTLSGTAPVGEVSVGSAGNERRLTNVAAGSAATDAVNVSQLKSEDAKVNAEGTSISNVIGGGTTYDASTGTITGPTFNIDGSTITTIAGAITNIDGRVTKNTTDISNITTQITNGEIGLVQQAGSTATITVARGTAGSLVDFTGTAGARRLTGVANGNVNASSVDAVNGSQLFNVAQSTANAIGGGSTVNGDGTISNPTYVVGGNTYNNVGGAITSIDGRVTNINNTVTNIVNGGGIKYFHANSTLADSVATGVNSVAIGGNASATTANSVALGSNATTTANLSGTAYNPGSSTLSGTAPVGEVSVGSAGNERRLTNVAAGSAATDAVNVSQLKSEDAKVNAEGTSISNVIGGGSTYDASTGTITGPTFNIGGSTITTIAGAITNIDGRVTQNTTDISNITTQITNGEIGLVQQAGSTATITVARGTAGSLVDFTGTAGARRLTGVANGNVNASSVDAVNGSQLFNVAQSTANAIGGGSTVNGDGTISNPTYVVGGNTYNNVGGAITSIDGRVTNINNTVTNIVNGGGIKYFHANSTLADSVATGVNSVAIGGNASATTANSVALGSNATTTANLSGTAYNPGSSTLSGTAPVGEVSVGSAGNERRLTNVAAGSAATDAVNVSQLKSEDAKVNAEGTSISNVIGGGSTYDASTGTITGPTFNIGGSTITTIAGAITNIDGRVTQNTTDISNITTQISNGEIGLVQQAGSTATITVARGTAGSLVDFTGTAGARKLTGVANGNVNASSVDAVNGSQLFNVAQSTANAIGGGSTVNGDGTISNPTYVVGGNTYNNVGGAITSIDGRVTNINNTVTNIVNGGGIKYFHANSTLADSVATGVNSVAIGGNASATTANSVALGSNATTTANLSGTAYNPGSSTLSGTAPVGEVSVGSAGNERRLTNVAAGSAATDAVNVSQLKSEDAKVNAEGTSISNVIGGGSTYDASTGTITGPTFNIGGSTITTIAGAITNIDGRVTQNTTDISNITTQISNGEIGLVQQAGSTATITVARGTAGSLVDFTGTAGARKLTGVANGNVNASSVDAVNGSQLFNVAQSTANAFGGGSTVNTDGTISNPTYVINGGNTTINNVGDAITNIDGRVTKNTTDISNINSQITQITNGEIGLVQQAGSTATITVARGTAGSLVDFTGTAGARKLTGVANGNVNVSSVDAVNGSQLFNVAQSTANAMGGGSTVNTDGTISNPTYVVGGNTYNNVGGAITSIDGRVTNINNTVTNIVNGGGIKYFHANSTLADSVATGVNSVAIGGNASATTANSVALGSNATTTANLSATAYNPGSSTLSGTAPVGEVSVGSAGNERRLTNVAAGSAATDAVNVSQLKSEDAKVNAEGTSISNVIGGGSTYDASTGTITGPTFNIGGSTITTIAGAITNIDGRVTKNTTDISNITTQITNGEIGLVQQAGSTATITVARGTAGSLVDFTGTAGARRLTGVANGNVNASSVDAVNGSQLFNVAQSTANAFGGGSTVNTDGTISAPTYVINGGTTVHNAGDAITNIDGRVTQNTTDISNINSQITQITNGEIGLVQQAGSTATITVARGTAGSLVDFTGTAGARKLTGVANGNVNVSSVDAVNGSQLFNVAQSTANAIGGGSTVNSDGTISNPTYIVGGDTVNSVGDAITNIDDRVTNIDNSINNIVSGGGIKYFHTNSTLADSVATGVDSVAIGGNASATTDNSVALGSNSTTGAVIATTGATIGGQNYSFAGSAPVGTVSVGSAGQERTITNVAAGQLSASSTDAVNGSQLYATNQAVNQVQNQVNNISNTVNNLSAGSVQYDKNPDGSVNYSSITMGGGNAPDGTVIHNVAAGADDSDAVNKGQMDAAIAAVTNIANNASDPMFVANGDRDTQAASAKGSYATAMGPSASASGDQSVAAGNNARATGQGAIAIGANSQANAQGSIALGSDSVADRTNTVSVGSATNQRQITNVAAGTQTTDAVNVGQLNDSITAAVGDLPAGTTAKSYTDQQVNMVQQGVNSVARNAYSGIAAATALTMIPDVDQGKTIAVGIGAGSYHGYQATALGASARITQNIKVKLGAGISGQGTTVGVGASYQW